MERRFLQARDCEFFENLRGNIGCFGWDSPGRAAGEPSMGEREFRGENRPVSPELTVILKKIGFFCKFLPPSTLFGGFRGETNGEIYDIRVVYRSECTRRCIVKKQCCTMHENKNAKIENLWQRATIIHTTDPRLRFCSGLWLLYFPNPIERRQITGERT